jgi:hypothetical protein
VTSGRSHLEFVLRAPTQVLACQAFQCGLRRIGQ